MPSNDQVTIKIDLQEQTVGSLVLCDINGKVMEVLSEGVFDMQNEYTMSLADYPQGIYMLKLSTDKGNVIKKISK